MQISLNRSALNWLDTSKINFTVVDDAGEDESEISATIVADSLVNADINTAAAILLTKLQNINTARLLGRQTAAAGSIEEISLNATLELVAATTLQRAALTGDVTSPAGSNVLTYNPLSIVDADINGSAAIAQAKLNLAITNAELSGSAGITFANMQNIATDRLLGRETAASGVIEEISLDATLLLASLQLRRAAITGVISIPAGSNASVFNEIPFTKGGTVLDPDVRNIIVWRAPFACTVTNVRGYRVGGTTASINARKNGTDEHLSSDNVIGTPDVWDDGGAVSNTAYAIGDKLEIMITVVTGSPTQVAVQVDFERP